jgi:hypothetical protein
VALPPDPLAEVLPEATAVVEATVIAILDQGPPIPPPKRSPQEIGGDLPDPWQTVRLRVTRVLHGSLEPGELTVTKPQAPYLLRPEVSGPFLLREEEGEVTILGRYGPDSYALAAIERALA